MGSLAAVADSFDGSGDALEAQKEVVTALSELANQQLATFQLQVERSYLTAGTQENPTFPVKLMTLEWKKTYAYSSDSAGQLTSKLQEATSNFLRGGSDGVSSGIFNLVDAALTALFVDSTGADGQEMLYFVYCSNGTVRRLDMACWYRNVTATAIRQRMRKSSCFIIREASINCEKVDWYSFISVVKDSLKALNLPKARYETALAEAEADFIAGGGKKPSGAPPLEEVGGEGFAALQERYRRHLLDRASAFRAPDFVDLSDTVG